MIGAASLNLAEFVSAAGEKDIDLTIPLTTSCGAAEPRPSLHVCELNILYFILFLNMFLVLAFVCMIDAISIVLGCWILTLVISNIEIILFVYFIS